MALITSHVLDSTNGTSAVGVKAQLFRIDSNHQRYKIFDIKTDDEGRISQAVENEHLSIDCEFELIFHTGSYFIDGATSSLPSMRSVVLRFFMNDFDKRYHMPIMLSPHSYSVWSSC